MLAFSRSVLFMTTDLVSETPARKQGHLSQLALLSRRSTAVTAEYELLPRLCVQWMPLLLYCVSCKGRIALE